MKVHFSKEADVQLLSQKIVDSLNLYYNCENASLCQDVVPTDEFIAPQGHTTTYEAPFDNREVKFNTKQQKTFDAFIKSGEPFTQENMESLYVSILVLRSNEQKEADDKAEKHLKVFKDEN